MKWAHLSEATDASTRAHTQTGQATHARTRARAHTHTHTQRSSDKQKFYSQMLAHGRLSQKSLGDRISPSEYGGVTHSRDISDRRPPEAHCEGSYPAPHKTPRPLLGLGIQKKRIRGRNYACPPPIRVGNEVKLGLGGLVEDPNGGQTCNKRQIGSVVQHFFWLP